VPSSPNYRRDYRQERLTESPKRKAERAARNRARRALEKKLGRPIRQGYETDHVVPLDKGGSSRVDNLRERPIRKNRSYRRNSQGGLA
jgi:5-methylcytosine-specific restriction endonuclease McrA